MHVCSSIFSSKFDQLCEWLSCQKYQHLHLQHPDDTMCAYVFTHGAVVKFCTFACVRSATHADSRSFTSLQYCDSCYPTHTNGKCWIGGLRHPSRAANTTSGSFNAQKRISLVCLKRWFKWFRRVCCAIQHHGKCYFPATTTISPPRYQLSIKLNSQKSRILPLRTIPEEPPHRWTHDIVTCVFASAEKYERDRVRKDAIVYSSKKKGFIRISTW